MNTTTIMMRACASVRNGGGNTMYAPCFLNLLRSLRLMHATRLLAVLLLACISLPVMADEDEGISFEDFDDDWTKPEGKAIVYYEHYTESADDGEYDHGSLKVHSSLERDWHIIAQWNPSKFDYSKSSTISDISVKIDDGEWTVWNLSDVGKMGDKNWYNINYNISSLSLRYTNLPDDLENIDDHLKVVWLFFDDDNDPCVRVGKATETGIELELEDEEWTIMGMAVLMDDDTYQKYKYQEGDDLKDKILDASNLSDALQKCMVEGINLLTIPSRWFAISSMDDIRTNLQNNVNSNALLLFTGTDLVGMDENIKAIDETSITLSNDNLCFATDNDTDATGEDYTVTAMDIKIKVGKSVDLYDPENGSNYYKYAAENINVKMTRSLATGCMGSTCLPYDLLPPAYVLIHDTDDNNYDIYSTEKIPQVVYTLDSYDSENHQFVFTWAKPDIENYKSKPYPAFTPYMIYNNSVKGPDSGYNDYVKQVPLYAAPEIVSNGYYNYDYTFTYKKLETGSYGDNVEVDAKTGLCVKKIDESLGLELIGTMKNYEIPVEDYEKYDFFAYTQTTVSDQKVEYTDTGENYYVGTITGGEFVKLTTWTDGDGNTRGQRIKPFRSFIRVKGGTVNAAKGNPGSLFINNAEDNTTTAITEMETWRNGENETMRNDNAVYDLYGRKVAERLSPNTHHPSLNPGLYIVGGKKVVIK